MEAVLQTLGEEDMTRPTAQQKVIADLEDHITGLKLELEQSRRRNPRSDWSRTWQAVSVILSIAAIIFSAGIGWSKMSELQTRIVSLENVTQQLVKAQADQSKDTAVIISKVDAVSNSVSKIEGTLQPRSIPVGR